MNNQQDRIAEVYDGKSVFITGATGFMGKVLIERLLRTTNVNKLYLIIRFKRNRTSSERFIDILSDPLFDKLKDQMSIEEILSKVHLINGDCTKIDLDLSIDARQLITENVSIIYNFAATVNFCEKFKYAVEMNVRGVREVMKLANDCKNLEIFCNLSTAYCHLNEVILEEKAYNFPYKPNEVIEIVENSTEDEVEKILSPYLNETMLNSYIFTKLLTEKLVVEMNEKFELPVMICRPGVVLSTFSDPVSGWTDCFQAVSGFVAAYCTGMLRTFYVENGKKSNINVVPVDIAIGNIMLCTWNYITQKNSPETMFYNLESFPWDPLSHIYLDNETVKREYLLGYLLWYPKLKVTNSLFVHFLRSLLYHWIPAYIFDFTLKILGRKPFLVRTHQKMIKGAPMNAAACKKNYVFRCDKIKSMWNNLNERELKNYTGINYNEVDFVRNFISGMRKYLMKKDDEQSIKECEKRFKRFYIMDNVIKFTILFLFLAGLGRVIFNIFNTYW